MSNSWKSWYAKKKYNKAFGNPYGDDNYSEYYREPYDYGMYHNPDYNMRYNNWKRRNIYSREDYNPDRFKPVDHIKIDYPLAPLQYICDYYTESDYKHDCRMLKAKYIQMCKYPRHTKMYNGNWYGFKKQRSDMVKKINHCNEVFHNRYANNQIKPIYFMRNRYKKEEVTNNDKDK